MTTNIVKTLEQLNSYSCEARRNLLLRNMKINEKYVIISAQRHSKRKSGKTVIKLTLEKHYIYLPKRFNSISDEFLSEINKNKNYMIHSCGQWRKTYNLVFSNNQLCEIINYDVNELLDLNNFEYCPIVTASSSTKQN